jgi:motility quorum-sensing regulator/GCU-specific mRNA interferase toxin
LQWHHNGATLGIGDGEAHAHLLSHLDPRRNGAFALSITLEGVVALIQTITRTHFYKSMTSFADHTVWQDVYHVPHEGIILYVKFTIDAEGHLVISFKEK